MNNNNKFFKKISELKLDISEIKTKSQSINISENQERKTTTIVLKGKNKTGKGEDVIYDVDLHFYPNLSRKLKGKYSLKKFSELISKIKLFPEDKQPDVLQKNYRKWALESAGLDLALRQNKKHLPNLLNKQYSPLRFVVSPSMEKTNIDKLRDLIEKIPGIEFKLDVKPDWNEKTIKEIAELKRVKIVDFKSHYKNLGMDPSFELYKKVAKGIPDAILEDPVINEKTRDAFKGSEHRVTWDKPIISLKTVKNLPIEIKYLNIKPSRFGSIKSLFEVIEYCLKENIQMYAGGQFELDIGRGQAQLIASMFYPKTPNDIAPLPYIYEEKNLPQSPLKNIDSKGFRLKA